MQILQVVAEALPKGFKYEEVCQARIHFWGECFETRGFQPSPWTLRAPIVVKGETLGEVEVVYLENRSSRAPSNPFHLDQKKLVDLTAQKLGQLAEVRIAQRSGEMPARRPRPLPRPRSPSGGPSWTCWARSIRPAPPADPPAHEPRHQAGRARACTR